MRVFVLSAPETCVNRASHGPIDVVWVTDRRARAESEWTAYTQRVPAPRRWRISVFSSLSPLGRGEGEGGFFKGVGSTDDQLSDREAASARCDTVPALPGGHGGWLAPRDSRTSP